jgi:hypothetical protein
MYGRTDGRRTTGRQTDWQAATEYIGDLNGGHILDLVAHMQTAAVHTGGEVKEEGQTHSTHRLAGSRQQYIWVAMSTAGNGRHITQVSEGNWLADEQYTGKRQRLTKFPRRQGHEEQQKGAG